MGLSCERSNSILVYVVGQLYSVQYMGTFGAPDEGQMLYVWQGQTIESGLRCCAQHLIGIWGGRATTSSPHHHYIPTWGLVLVLDRPNTSGFMCISLEVQSRYTCIWAWYESVLISHNFLFGYLTKLHHYLLSVIFLPPAPRTLLSCRDVSRRTERAQGTINFW